MTATMAVAVPAARALQARELAGWWIAIDDTFPRLWQREAISPMEEVLQINPDGRVQDRVMNFWAGSPQACLDDKVCSDLPLIGVAQLRLNGDRVAFVEAAPSKARLDIGTGDAVIRRAAVTATAEWTIKLEGERMTLRSSDPAKVRVLVRVDPDRLRRLHAGLRASTWPAAEHWRCFLANATAPDSAFAPLRHNRRHQAPAFLDRYLKLASYIGALQSTILLPAIDETDAERRKLLGAPTEEMLVQHYDNLLRPPTADDRPRLEAVLTTIYQHAHAINASNAAAAAAAQAKAGADAAAQEAAKLSPVASSAAAAASAAQAKAKSAAAELEKAKAAAAASVQAAGKAELAAREAAAAAAALQAAAEAAAIVHEAAKEAAAAHRRHSAMIAAAAQRLSEAVAAARDAVRNGAETATALQSALASLIAAHDTTKAEAETAADEAARRANAAQSAQSRASEALAAAKSAPVALDKASAQAKAAAQEAAKRAQEAERAAAAATAAQDAAALATAKADEAKAKYDAAALEAARTAAAAHAAASAAKAAQEALKAIAAAQPKNEGLPPIAGADIAALARVLGDSDEAKALFCRDGHGAPGGATPVSATAAPARSSPNETGTVTVPLPLARPAPRR